jgi:hypothetical protein
MLVVLRVKESPPFSWGIFIFMKPMANFGNDSAGIDGIGQHGISYDGKRANT